MSSNQFVKKLASNSRQTREIALASLRKYLSSRSSSSLTLLELEKLWKGLYFAMWFSDRPLPQQKLAESLGELYSEIIDIKIHATFVEAFWVIITKEWPQLDQWRIDKFLMLIRRVLRHNFLKLKMEEWDSQYVKEFVDALEKIPLSGNKEVAPALSYHLCDIYLDELALVAFDDVEEEKQLEVISSVPVKQLIAPFEKLNKNALLKPLREKCKQEVLDDKRLREWNVVDLQKEDGEEDEEKEEEEEWTGF